MSLKDESILWDEVAEGSTNKWFYQGNDVDNAIKIYLEARDHPERHEELVKEYKTEKPHAVISELLKPWEEVGVEDMARFYIQQTMWRDWLFKKIIGE